MNGNWQPINNHNHNHDGNNSNNSNLEYVYKILYANFSILKILFRIRDRAIEIPYSKYSNAQNYQLECYEDMLDEEQNSSG